MRLLIFLILFSLIIPLQILAAEGPEDVEFPSRWGIVTFKHYRHQARVNDCLACHHQGMDMGSCRSCHGVLPNTPLSKDALHKRCKDCHREKRGPTECSGCHNPEFVDEDVFQDN